MAPSFAPSLIPWFANASALPSNVTATGYSKGADLALVVLLIAGGIAGSCAASGLAIATRHRSPRTEGVLLAFLWVGCAVCGTMAFNP